MIVAPTVPGVLPRSEGSSLRRVLAVVGGDTKRDERTLRWACALSREHQARLTILCLWSLPPMWPWVALSGAGAAVQMLELHRRELIRWLDARVSGEVADPVRVLTARHCDSPARVVAAELSRGDYSCVVGSRRTIGRRAARRVRRGQPELTLVRL
jgi:hypothetical protein